MHRRVLLDANVLIDYQSDLRFVLEVLAASNWHFSVVTDVLAEVKTGNFDDFPLEIITPTAAQRILCNDRPRRLSEQDMLCILCSKDCGLSCATNDVRLKKELVRYGIPVHTSLSLLEAAGRTQMIQDEVYGWCVRIMTCEKKYKE